LLLNRDNCLDSLLLNRDNESIEEISTNNIKYLLLPAILADFTLKLQSIDNRLDSIKRAEIYFKDFIQRLNDYQICDIEVKQSDDSPNETTNGSRLMSTPSLESAAISRNQKINRYREGKELDFKLKEFREQLSQTKGSVDDEILRDYYLTLLKRWINNSLDELHSIETEKPILEHMLQMKSLALDHKKEPKIKSEKIPLKPIIITRNEIQKKIYGLGYPSIPTVSIDEFVNKKIEEGTLAITDPNIYSNSLLNWAEDPDQKLREDELEEERKEGLAEKEDLESLRKQREWDEWKDEHKRGEGNRKNMG